MSQNQEPEIIDIPPRYFLIACAVVSAIIFWIGRSVQIPAWVLGAEVMLIVLSLFVFGSIRIRLDKNALTYGMALVVLASFWSKWWPGSQVRGWVEARDMGALMEFFHHHFLTLHGLDELFHADTMLFILGLTLFVCVIAQTRILETVSFAVLKKTKGNVFVTVAILTAIVAAASGILDGVSMIGLMIRTMVILLFLSKTEDSAILFAVMVSTIVTTVCGMWLAYGEPPNLIMKANLHPHLDNMFFLRYCLPVAIGTYFLVVWNIKRKMGSKKVDIASLDILDMSTDDVRFLQAERHGEVLTPIEFVEARREKVGAVHDAVIHRLHQGEPLGSALVKENVPENVRKELMGEFVAEDLADALDSHYKHDAVAGNKNPDESLRSIKALLNTINGQRIRSQMIGGLSFIPFIGLLIWHAIDHNVPLFLASFAGFAVALMGIIGIPKMRKLAIVEAKHEYVEYLFLLPLFFSITLLQKSGFFEIMTVLLHQGIDKLGAAHMAYIQFTGATFLSALLDNNIVADFTSRALHGLDLGIMHLFSMAQIAGYATGGCWTHVGSAQSVVAFAFILKEVDDRFTPFQWIKTMTPIIIQIFILMTLVVYGEGMLLQYLEH